MLPTFKKKIFGERENILKEASASNSLTANLGTGSVRCVLEILARRGLLNISDAKELGPKKPYF
jgi:hypothetical protein